MRLRPRLEGINYPKVDLLFPFVTASVGFAPSLYSVLLGLLYTLNLPVLHL